MKYTLQELMDMKGTSEPVRSALQAMADEIEALRRDAGRLDWLLWKLPGDAIRHCVGEISDTSDLVEFRAAIDAAMKA